MISPHQDQEDDRRVRHLVAELLDPVEHLLHQPLRFGARHGGGVGHHPSVLGGGVKSERELGEQPGAEARSNRRCARCCRCRSGRRRRCRGAPTACSPTNSARNRAARDRAGVLAAEVLDVGQRGVEVVAVSAGEGSSHTGSSVASAAASTWAIERAGRCRSPPRSRVPRARSTAPVRVAMSTIASVGSSVASTRRVGHDEAALGVGVDDLDRGAAADRDHVAHLDAPCPTACCRCTSGSR